MGLFGGTTSNGLGIHLRTDSGLTNSTVLNSVYIYSWLRNASKSSGSAVQTINLDQWYHLAITYNSNNILKFYINGTLIDSRTVARASTVIDVTTRQVGLNMAYCQLSNADANTKHLLSLKEYFNDVRIYDHCLSAAEIKEISQGLILHYKLDDNIQTISNAFNMTSWDTNTSRGGFSSWGSSGHQGSYGTNTDRSYIYNADRTYSYWVANGSESTPLTYLFYQSPAFEGGYRSLSAILKEENGALITENIIRPSWNANVTGTGHAPAATWTRVITLGNGFYLCQVDGLYQDGSNDLVGLSITRGHKVYISEIWLENDKQIASDPLFSSTTIKDNSGYNNNGTVVGDILTISDTPRYNSALYFNSASYIKKTDLNFKVNTWTISTWFKKTSSTTDSYDVICGLTRGNGADTNKKFALYIKNVSVGFVGEQTSHASIATIDKTLWHHVCVTNNAGTYNYYLDGVLKNTYTNSNNLTDCTDFVVGGRAAVEDATSASALWGGNISDVRLYCTALSADDVKQLYQVNAKIDNLGSLHTFEFQEKGPNKITKIGITQGQQINEINNLSQLKYDPNVYIEPDGSAWVRIFHHNNPVNARFTSSDTFATSVYKDANRWFNVQVCDNVTTWEFMLKQRAESTTTTESKYRWIQTVNPMTASYEDVAAASITKITTGYSNFSHGGLYKKNGSTYLCTNNGTSSNWWGAVGAWTLSSGGNPSWASTVVKSGYIDLYLRIDNITTTLPQIAKSTKNNIWIAHTLIEK